MLAAGVPLIGRNYNYFHHRNPPGRTIRSSSSSPPVIEVPVSSSSSERDLSSSLKASSPFPPLRVAKRVVLVRHGQSTWNEEGRIQGSSDFSVLTQKGESQAETSRQMLIDDSFDICFSSPLIRSKRTAEVIWGSRKEDILTDLDLREIDLYSFQGLLKHEGKAKFGPAYSQWQKDAANFNIDGHYPVRELWARARNCWDKILAHESRSVLVVAHNAVNQALVATAIGLGTEYFRILLQSNCGVSVLDFVPRPDGGSPSICLNRLNQADQRSLSMLIINTRLQAHLLLKEALEAGKQARGSYLSVTVPPWGIQRLEHLRNSIYDGQVARGMSMNMLGIIQSQKTAELLLDSRVKTIFSSPSPSSSETANAIARVQEAADCLGADCVPRYVETKQIKDLDVQAILQQSNKDSIGLPVNQLEDELLTELWDQSGKAWKTLLDELSSESESENVLVAVTHPAINIALLSHCLSLTKEWIRSFHLDAGSISVIDFPDGPAGRGVVRCINYTAHLGRWSIPITRATSNDEEF